MDILCKLGLHKWKYSICLKKVTFYKKKVGNVTQEIKVYNRKCSKCNKCQQHNPPLRNGEFEYYRWKTIEK